MQIKNKFNPVLAVILLLVGLTSAVCAQDDSWQEKRSRLQAEIERRVQAEVDREVKPEKVALACGLKWPVATPKKRLDEVFAEAEAAHNAALEKEYPSRLQEEIKQEAQRLYGYCKVGDEVTIRTTGKMGHEITGRLQTVTPARIRIANRWVNAVDLDRDTMARFIPEQAQEVQTKYVERETRRLRLRMDDFSRRFRRKTFPGILRQNGDRPLEELNGPEFLHPANGFPSLIGSDRLFAARQACEQQLAPEIAEEVYTENGFYYDDGTQAWLPVELRPKEESSRPASSRRGGVFDKLKRLFR